MTHAPTHAPKAICPINFFNVGGIINNILTTSARECAPTKGKSKKIPKLKVMTPKIQSAIHAKKHAFHLWKQNGRSNDSSNFYVVEKKLKTVELRRQTRTEIAGQRNEEKMCVLNAHPSDNALFHCLIKKQRGSCSKFIDELHVGKETFSQDNIINGCWPQKLKILTMTLNI